MMDGRLIVSVDLLQKREGVINGVKFAFGKKYNHNFRESSPVVAIVKESSVKFKEGDSIVCHHNHFYGDSPYHMGDDLYSIPINKSIFAKISNDGYLQPVCGNLICERIDKKSLLDLPPMVRKTHNDRVRVLVATDGFSEGEEIFTELQADYEIVYNWGGEERRAIKVFKEEVVAVLKK